MEHWICVTCGVQFAASQARPQTCPICSDERQYTGYHGQQWTTLALMKAEGYHHKIKEHEPQLIGVGTNPSFAIGQRALLVQTGKENVLWDCISYLDDDTVEEIKRLGGVHAIAISHPHFYGSMVEFAQRFDAPIYLHEADRQWVMKPDSRIKFWSGETMRLLDAVTLVRLGGHFPGSTVLHWADGANGNGLLLTGDTIQVVADRNWVSFMRSFPNIIPLPAAEVARIRDTIASYPFERLYGGWFDRIIAADANNAVIKSADRYIRALEEKH